MTSTKGSERRDGTDMGNDGDEEAIHVVEELQLEKREKSINTDGELNSPIPMDSSSVASKPIDSSNQSPSERDSKSLMPRGPPDDESHLAGDMAAVGAMLHRLKKFHAPKYFYSPTESSSLARKYPFIRREAAVLIPLVRDSTNGGQLRVLLTKRSQLMRSHKGEVAFPGGVRDSTDHGPIETALREAYEEVGLPYEYVRVGAALTPILTRHDYLIYPVIGYITKEDFQPRCNEEVEKCFTVPLRRFLTDRGHYVRKFRAEQSGREFLSHFFEDRIGENDVQVTFGITAVICIWAAMLVYERNPTFPMYLFETEEMHLSFDRLMGEWERLLETYLARRMAHVQGTISSRL